jgi:hypothetical protein
MGEDPVPPAGPDHLGRLILARDRRLFSGLEVEIGREQAVRRLLHHHHRVPVVDVRGLEESERVLAEIQRLAIAEPSGALVIAEAVGIEDDRERRD